MVPLDGEPVELSLLDLRKLESLPSVAFRRYAILGNSSQTANAQRHNEIAEKLTVLRNYNRQLQAAGESVVAALPTSVEEAVDQGYVEAKVIYGLFGDRFNDQSALSKYLDHADRRDRIRSFKPTRNRRMVHAADFLTELFADDEAELRADCKRHGEKPPRRNKTGK
jgi:hypothetical protein